MNLWPLIPRRRLGRPDRAAVQATRDRTAPLLAGAPVTNMLPVGYLVVGMFEGRWETYSDNIRASYADAVRELAGQEDDYWAGEVEWGIVALYPTGDPA